jgi:glycosyltransferase involved in cell wall biosynthesis
LQQTWQDFELWILENGSTDQTLAVAKQFEQPPRVRVFDLGPVGFQRALQFALQNVQSEWIARMDGDDVAVRERLEKQVAFVRSHPQYYLLGADYAVVTPFNHVYEVAGRLASRPLTTHSFTLIDSSARRFCGDPTVLFKRQAALQVGGYDLDFSLGDVPLWIRILQKYPGWEMADLLYLYRLQPNSVSQTNPDGCAIRRKYGLSVPEQDGELALCPRRMTPRATYWRRILKLELRSGDSRVLWKVARCLWSEGEYRLALLGCLFACAGKSGAWLHARRYPQSRLRRKDLEATYAALLPSGPSPA